MAVFLLTFRHTFTADSIQYAMRPAFLIFLSGLVVSCFACWQTNEGNASSHASSICASTNDIKYSRVFFVEAEDACARGTHRNAAAALHKGIIAYRIETGKMHGSAATQANRAIDALTRLRQSLREGKVVSAAELHSAIQNALALENLYQPSKGSQLDLQDLFVPVGKH